MTHMPQFSIDLDAELIKITQRQHLNDVHYLVGLVRHALSLHPKAIQIDSTKHKVCIQHDGDPLDMKEWEALILLLSRTQGEEDKQQQALSQLETVFGIALLSTLLRFPKVRLATGVRQVVVENGRIATITSIDPMDGYEIEFNRPSGHRLQERSELEFYCHGAAVPLFFNNKPLNKPLTLSDHFLAMDFQTETGHGSIAIPTRGELSRFYYFKAGVRVGVKTFRSETGQIVEGFWNYSDPGFECLYRQTIQSGQNVLEQHTQSIYRTLAQQFPNLEQDVKRRLKRILLRIEPIGWAKAFGTIPLFANSVGPFVLALEDLKKLRRTHETIPFLTQPDKKSAGHIPVLSSDDQFFLNHQLRLPLQLLVTNHNQSAASVPPPKAISAHVPAPASGPWLAFEQALNQHNLPLTFHLCATKSLISHGVNGKKEVWLPCEDPLVIEALNAFQANPSSAHLWRYRLLAALS